MLDMIVESNADVALFNHFAAMRTIINLKIGFEINTDLDGLTASIALLAPNLVTLEIGSTDFSLASIFPLLAKCQSLVVRNVVGMDLIGPHILPALKKLDILFVQPDAVEMLSPFLKGRSEKLEELHVVIYIDHPTEAEAQNYDLIELGKNYAVHFEWDVKRIVSDHCLYSTSLDIDVDAAAISRREIGNILSCSEPTQRLRLPPDSTPSPLNERKPTHQSTKRGRNT